MRRHAVRVAGTPSTTRAGALARLTVAICAALCAALVFSGSASAAYGEEVGSFNCSGTPEEFCGNSLIAVDEASGDVFLIDTTNGVIDRFDSSGNFLSVITPSTGSFAFPGNGAEDIAIDNSGTVTQGNLYVAYYGGGVFAFEPEPSEPSGYKELWERGPIAAVTCWVAVDPSGHPWAADYSGESVTEMEASTGNKTGTPISTAGHGGPCHIAFDSAGNLLANTYTERIDKYGSSGSWVEELTGSSPAEDVATDRSTDNVYSAYGQVEVRAWNSTGTPLAGFAGGGLGPKAVTIDASRELAYISAASGDSVRVFDIASPVVEFPLSLTTTGGTGTGSIECDTGSGPEACAAEYVEGTEVTLTQSAASGSEFVEWTGDCSGTGACEVTMNAAHSVGAKFDLEAGAGTLHVYKGGNGAGTVTSNPAGINCGTEPCEAAFAGGETVILTASAGSGSVFAGWLGCKHLTATTCEVTVNGETEVTAVFLAEGPQGNPGGTGPQGNPGNTGPQGIPGTPGAQGPAGSTGATGAAGSQGAKGDKGDPGATGATGPQGPAAKVTCKVKNGAKKVKVTCTVKQGASASRVHWRLSRAGHTVSHGAARRGRIQLGYLRPGHYRLHVEGQRGSTALVIG